MTRYRVLAAFLLLAATLFLPVSASAVVSGNVEALFADPAIETRLVSMVDSAAAGSTIRASLGTGVGQSIVDRLLVAQDQRQVTVLAVAERCPAKDSAGTCLPPPAPLTALAGGLTAGRFTWCDEGCLSGIGSASRATFYVFDALTDGRVDLVAQPSGGLSAAPHHNLLVSANDTALSAAYRGYFGQLVARAPVTFTGSVTGDDGKTEVFFQPHAADAVAAAVNAVACPGTIRVATGAFAAARTALVSALTGRKQAGCTVQVVLTDRNDALAPLGAAGIQVSTFRPGTIGSQYVLVEDATRKLVYAGTARYTAAPDDGTILRVNDATIYAGYVADWQAMATEAVVLRPDQWPHAAWSTANSVATGDQDNAQISASRNGHLAVVWEDDRDATDPASELHSEVFIRLYRDGASGYEKKISPDGTGNWTHVRPDVAVDDNGNAVVAWLDDPDGNGFYNVAVSVLNAAGAVLGTAQANADSTGQQLAPTVAIDPDGGGFTVAWEDRAATPFAIRAAGYASITSKRYEVQVNGATTAAGTQRVPDVASDAAGNSVVVWQEDSDGNGSFNIAMKVLTATGGVKLSQRSANAVGDRQQTDPAVACSFAGDFAVAWQDDRAGPARVFVRSFSASGAPLHIDQLVAPGDEPPGVQAAPVVGIDDQGSVVVGWTEAGFAGAEPWLRGFNPDGTTAGRFPPARMSVFTSGIQSAPSLAVSSYGEITVAYADDLDGNQFDQVLLRTGFNNSLW